jgi:hypothetical protein
MENYSLIIELLAAPKPAQQLNEPKVSRTCTAISYVDSDLKGQYPVVQCDGLLFSSSLLITESDRSICLISFYETYDRGSLLSHIDIGMAVRLVYYRGAFYIGNIMQLRQPT